MPNFNTVSIVFGGIDWRRPPASSRRHPDATEAGTFAAALQNRPGYLYQLKRALTSGQGKAAEGST
jgi:hypothetical protein